MLSTFTQIDFPDDLSPEMHAALTALAEIEARFEADSAFLAEWNGEERLKQRFVAQVKARRFHDREPLVQHLAELYQSRLYARLFWQAHGRAAPLS